MKRALCDYSLKFAISSQSINLDILTGRQQRIPNTEVVSVEEMKLMNETESVFRIYKSKYY